MPTVNIIVLTLLIQKTKNKKLKSKESDDLEEFLYFVDFFIRMKKKQTNKHGKIVLQNSDGKEASVHSLYKPIQFENVV